MLVVFRLFLSSVRWTFGHVCAEHAHAKSEQNHGSAAAESYTDYSVVISPEGIDGLTVGAGIADHTVASAASTDVEENTIFATYAIGSMTIGVQFSDYDHSTANSDQESTAIGISYAVNDDISVS